MNLYKTKLSDSLWFKYDRTHTSAIIGIKIFMILISRTFFKHVVYLNQIAKKRLPASKITQFEAIFQYASEGILTTDREGNIRTVNPAACLLFQYTEKELVGQKIEILIPKRYGNHVSQREGFAKKPHARAMAGGLDLFALKKSGDEFPVEVSLSPYHSNGETLVIAFIIDVSARKEAEERERNYRKELEREVEDRTLILKEAVQKLEKTKANLDLALQREKDANMMKTRFVSIASHEFRTPLSTMLSSLVLIEKYAGKGEIEKQDKHIERIKKSIKSLSEILNDILSINKLEEGKVNVKPREFNALNLFENVISELSLILKTDQRIDLNWKASKDLFLVQDETLLCHVVTNLVSNAVKFSGEKSLIAVIVSELKSNVLIQVKDEGIGIPEDNIEKLFTRFYRADNAGQIQGTGLGLSIVKQYTELLEGQVSVKSKQGMGTTFEVSLPKNLRV